MRGDSKDESVQEDIAFWKRKDSLLIHHVLGSPVLRINLFLRIQGKQQKCRASNRGEQTDSSHWCMFCKTPLSEVEKWMGRVKHLSFVISKFVMQSFLLPKFHNMLALTFFFFFVGFLTDLLFGPDTPGTPCL